MGFGVQDAVTASGEHVPGTSTIFGDENDHEKFAIEARLKHGKGKESDVILVPQPSDSPNDPLNWPQWKKNFTFFSICLSVSMAACLGPVMSPITGVIAKEFGVTIQKAALPGGYPLMTTALGGLIAQAWTPLLGKRSFYIASTLILFVSTIWTSRVQTFSSLMGSRILQGFGAGAYESIVISTIGDMYFVHERGKCMVVYNIVSLGCATLTPVLAGYVSDKHGWRMSFNILIAFTGLALLFVIFACPETTYVRSSRLETDMISVEDLAGVLEAEKTPKSVTLEKEASATATTEKPKTYWEELKPFNGLITRQNPLILLARPFACFVYPAVFWGFTVGGLWSSWTIGLGIVVAQIFAAPPNLFSPTKLGLLFVFSFVLLLLGCLLGLFLADWWPQFCARRNKGVFEPEFRLILLIPVLFVGIPGLFGFGYYASRPDVIWMAASCLQGLISFSSVLAASVAYGYVLDCHRNHSIDVSVAILLLRNFFWFGSSYFLPAWLAASKTWKVFDIIGSLQLGITLCSIFLYIYGKRLRLYLHQHDPLVFFHLV